MAASQEAHASEGQFAPTESRRGQVQYKTIAYKVQYASDDDPDLREKLKLLFDLSTKSTHHRHKGFWASCCSSLLRNVDPLVLGHPVQSFIRLKDLLDYNDLTTEERFIDFMLTTLPRNEQGQIRVPEVNMMHHKGPDVKLEPKDEAEQDSFNLKTVTIGKFESIEKQFQHQRQEIDEAKAMMATVNELLEANKGILTKVEVASSHQATRDHHQRPQNTGTRLHCRSEGCRSPAQVVPRRL